MAGSVNHCAGKAAEDSVAGDYDRRGRHVAHRRWRGLAGEIDLIARDGEGYVFVEVKRARSFDQAALRLGRRQMDRIIAAACEFLGTQPGGMLAAMRFDLALVDGRGAVRIIENAFGEA
jgi:putative endonuclease